MTDLSGRAHFSISRDEIDSMFARYIVEEVSTATPRYGKEVARQLAKFQREDERGVPMTWLDDAGRRTTALVNEGYTRLWSSVSLAEQLSSPKATWFEWGDRLLRARAIGRKHLHHLVLVRALEWLSPSSALEVGSGFGFNLLLLSMQFPEVQLSGVELTEAGVTATYALVHDPSTSSLLEPLTIRPVVQPPTLPSGAIRQGSAARLPLEDKSFDVVFTVLALEQMNDIRGAVLQELTRVARRHVVMIEPFRDWNPDGLRRRYIERHSYFDPYISELEQHGLRPIVTTEDFPNKITFHVGLVVAAVK
jgi:ubiquinone/menaquinone biosynthesis C-methylase UbiE